MGIQRHALVLALTALTLACGGGGPASDPAIDTGATADTGGTPTPPAGPPATPPADPPAPLPPQPPADPAPTPPPTTPPPPVTPPPPPPPVTPPPTLPPPPFPAATGPIAVRESFGFGDGTRPQGGNGDPRQVFAGRDVGGYWVEQGWSTGDTWGAASQGWKFAGCSVDPYEAASPLQIIGNGCAHSEWRDGVVWYPDALAPFTGLSSAYELSADVYPGVLSGAYVAIGLSGSGALTDNLKTSGQLWVLVRQGPKLDGIEGEFELRAGGTLLAAGAVPLAGFMPVSLRYDPVAGKALASVNGVAVGPFDVAGVAPSHAVLEGQGTLDNVVVRAVE